MNNEAGRALEESTEFIVRPFSIHRGCKHGSRPSTFNFTIERVEIFSRLFIVLNFSKIIHVTPLRIAEIETGYGAKVPSSRRVKPKRTDERLLSISRYINIDDPLLSRGEQKLSTVIAVDLVALAWRHLLISKQRVSYRPHIISLTSFICT